MIAALEILKNFCQADFVERNPQKAVGFLAKDILWFGTSDGEDVHGREEALRYISDEISANPEPLQIEYTHEHSTVISDESGSVLLKLAIISKDVVMHCRMSATTRIEDGAGKLAVLHMSVSNTAQAANEYFPVSLVAKREKEIREQLLNETVAGGMMGGYMEPEFPFYFVNQRMLQTLGYTDEKEFVQDIDGKIAHTMHPDDRDNVAREVYRQLSIGNEYTVEYRMKKKDGSYIWVHDIGREMTVENGQQAITSVCYDITEQKRAQQELALSQNKLTAVIRYADLQAWEYDVQAGRAYIGDCSNGQYEISEVLDNFPEAYLALDYIYPDDKERYRNMHKALREGAAECEEQVRVRSEGEQEYTWLLCKYVNVFDDAGNPVRAIGMAQSLEQYKELEERFFISAVQTGVALWTLDISTRTINWNSVPKEYFNEADMKIDAITEDFFFSTGFIHPEDVPKVLKKYQELYDGQPSCTFDARIKMKDGTYGWFRTFYTLVKDRYGKPLRAIGTAINIDEQTKAEEKYNQLVDNYHNSVGTDNLIVGNCNITQNKMIGIIDSTDSGLLERFGEERETFFTRFSEQIVGEDKQKEFLDMYLNQPLKDAYQRGQTAFKTDCLIRLRDGSAPIYTECSVKIAKSPETQDLIGFLRVRNIDEQRRAELKLEETKQLIACVIEKDYDYIIDVNTKEDTYENINGERQDVSYFPVSGIYSQTVKTFVKEYVAKEDAELVTERLAKEYILQSLKGSSAYYFNFHVKMDGKVFTKKMNVFDIDFAAGRIAVTCEDITEALCQEQRQNELLSTALFDAKKANAAKSEFLSRMSHEIRTPMNAILGLTQLAQMSEGLSPDVAGKLEKINASSKFLLSLVSDILDMSKIESQKMRIERHPFRLGMLTSELKDLFSSQAAKKGINYTYECDREDTALIGDELRIKQILVNLLSNALKFTHKGGTVHLSIKEQAHTDTSVTLYFDVRDSGIGISEQDSAKIFKTFEQAAVEGTHRERGTGLGLSISYNLAELMGGRLTMESEVGKGSLFFFVLELPFAGQAGTDAQEEGEGADLNEKCFLLAEDNDLNADITMEILKYQGAKVEWAKDGKEAVDMFTAHPADYYDGILMDILMPRMTGLEAAEAIRKCGRRDGTEIPIIAMTANAFQEDWDKAIASGMNGFIPKPFEIKQLYQVLKASMKKERNESGKEKK